MGTSNQLVFPARAGMSRTGLLRSSRARSVPRASGDEPSLQSHILIPELCSPRERG